MSEKEYISAYIEEMHSILMDKFHNFRKTKTTDLEVIINGKELNNIITKAKQELYKKRPDAANAGFKLL